MRQLTRPAHAGVEGLLPRIIAVAAMGFQEVMAVCGERRIVIAFASISIAVTDVATVARIVWFAIKSRLMTPLYPWHLDVADVIVAVAGIEVERRMLSSMAETIRVHRDGESDYAKRRSPRQFVIGRRRIL